MEKEITWITLTDGRKEFIKKTIPCWEKNIQGSFSNKIIIDDSGDSDYRAWLKKTFKNFEVIAAGNKRVGYTNAMKKVFNTALESGSPYVFHLEDDFLIKENFDLNNFVNILEKYKYLTQMSFLRDPWYENEIRDGGVMRTLMKKGQRVHRIKNKDGAWMEHRIFWTCNPSVYPLWVAKNSWPNRKHSEFYFGRELFEKNRNYKSAVWGKLNDEPLIKHIGAYQKGGNY